LRGRLLILNLILLGLIALAGSKLRSNWMEARAREQAFLRMRLPAVPAPQVLIPPPPAPVPAADYIDIATRLLLSRDRNPSVFVEQVKPKPMPPLPRFHGVMNFGEGPSVILSQPGKPNSQKSFHIGEQVGEFKLVAVENTGLTFDWEGKKIKSSYADLRDNTPAQEAAPPATSAQSASPGAAVTSVTQIASPAQDGRPGIDVGAGTKSCNPGDTSPAGTIADGFRKVVVRTPFGSACRWEPVK
jgi:hypothetical protein